MAGKLAASTAPSGAATIKVAGCQINKPDVLALFAAHGVKGFMSDSTVPKLIRVELMLMARPLLANIKGNHSLLLLALARAFPRGVAAAEPSATVAAAAAAAADEATLAAHACGGPSACALPSLASACGGTRGAASEKDAPFSAAELGVAQALVGIAPLCRRVHFKWTSNADDDDSDSDADGDAAADDDEHMRVDKKFTLHEMYIACHREGGVGKMFAPCSANPKRGPKGKPLPAKGADGRIDRVAIALELMPEAALSARPELQLSKNGKRRPPKPRVTVCKKAKAGSTRPPPPRSDMSEEEEDNLLHLRHAAHGKLRATALTYLGHEVLAAAACQRSKGRTSAE